jgi:hypothetical protein
LGEESGVGRDGLGDGRESFVAGSENGFVALRELGEEGHTFGGVGEGGCDSSEGSQVVGTGISFILGG